MAAREPLKTVAGNTRRAQA